MTFNIAHGRGLSLYQGFQSAKRILENLKKIAQLLNDLSIDVVALQEVDEFSYWTKGLNLADCIQELAGFPHAILGVHNRRQHPKRPLAYGNAILSKFPILHSHTHPFGGSTLGEKGFLYAELRVAERVIPLINLHLDFRSRKRRLIQVDQLLDFLKSHEAIFVQDGSWPIICGDFNSRVRVPKDAVSYFLTHIGKSQSYTFFPEERGTFPAHLPSRFFSRALDFILVPDTYHWLCAEVVPVYLSDHRPVLIEIRWPKSL